MYRSDLVVFIVFIAGFAFSACNSYTPKTSGDGNQPTEFSATQPGYTVPTYAFVKAQVFQPYCISCHSSAGGSPHNVNLENYQNTIQRIDDVASEALVEKSMPPSHPLPAIAQTLLKAWIAGGAPEDGVEDNPDASPTPSEPQPSPTATPIPQPLAPKWDSISANILMPRCVSCHGAGTHVAHKIDLTKRDFVTNPANGVVDPGQPGTSLIIKAVTGNGEKLMPPRGGALTTEEINAIETWIQNGARD
jgi:mono/diheme cytochrome c family protein